MNPDLEYDDDAMRRLLAAVILRGARDAAHGSLEATRWLHSDDADWMADAVGIDLDNRAILESSKIGG